MPGAAIRWPTRVKTVKKNETPIAWESDDPLSALNAGRFRWGSIGGHRVSSTLHSAVIVYLPIHDGSTRRSRSNRTGHATIHGNSWTIVKLNRVFSVRRYCDSGHVWTVSKSFIEPGNSKKHESSLINAFNRVFICIFFSGWCHHFQGKLAWRNAMY